MPILLWDASALVKHYATEAGSATADAIFQAISSQGTLNSETVTPDALPVLLMR